MDGSVADRAGSRAGRRRPLRGSVLVVDDNADYRRIVALRMEHVGLSCRLAGTHTEALRLLAEDRESDIEVAVVDYHMGRANVSVLVRRIRDIRPDVTIVGHSSMERREHFAALGVDWFLLKPWTPEQLRALMKDRPR